MKSSIYKNILLFMGFATMLIGCEKTFDSKFMSESDFSNNSVVQVYMAMVNANRNYVYMNNKPVNGSPLVSGSIFPTTGYGFRVPGGLVALLVKDTLSTTTQPQLPFAQTYGAGKNYTIFIYDTISSPKQKTVETTILIPPDTTARLRFANFIYNPTALPAVEIFSKKRNQVIFSNVNTTEVTDFIPFASGLTDTLYIRTAGSGVNLQNRTGTTFSDIQLVLTPTMKRSYTLVWRGSWRNNVNGTSTVRALSFFANY